MERRGSETFSLNALIGIVNWGGGLLLYSCKTVVRIIKQDLCERKRGTGRKGRVKRAVDKAMAVSCANSA